MKMNILAETQTYTSTHRHKYKHTFIGILFPMIQSLCYLQHSIGNGNKYIWSPIRPEDSSTFTPSTLPLTPGLSNPLSLGHFHPDMVKHSWNFCTLISFRYGMHDAPRTTRNCLYPKTEAHAHDREYSGHLIHNEPEFFADDQRRSVV